ncbi:unnamed protein product [Owenia fusiformis]|uniref:Uncharacterized protein n=1 Tax=Owenia fusiformis TaxID=6347 RepID=A0A8J1U1R9_OWEFU|nr:unnamed protein product [Owenia fusiformis]
MERVRRKIAEINEESDTWKIIKQEDLNNYGLKDITLRPYQIEGINWLCQRFKRKHGCILGDEMGLGKTCQTISFLVYLHGRKKCSSPHIVLCPLSVINNWQTEIARFAPCLRLQSYLGDKDSRQDLRHEIKKRKRETGEMPFDVILTTYEILLKDEGFFASWNWGCLVVDEAHRLKNPQSQLHQALKEIDISHRILLTGTPVQNNLTELYSLLSFVSPSIFKLKYSEEFVETFSDSNKKTITHLHDLLKPFLLRRIKSEVVKDLAEKTEIVLYHGMSAVQKKCYKAILTKDLDVFDSGNPYNQRKTSLNNILVQLRKCVDHPYLFDGIEPEPFELGEHLVEASGKLVLVDQLLAHLKPLGHKVLIFSQMTRMLDIIQDYLGYRDYTYERLDGSVRGEERFLAVRNFNEKDDTFVFLLSTKAGGVGLNLVAADTVIFVDSDFNPQNDLQAAARAHRIGQTRPVKIIRLIGRSTVEEIILKRAEEKFKLTNSVIEGGQFSLGTNKDALITDEKVQLQDILKFGVDKLFESDEGTCEDVDFHAILGPTVNGEWQPVEEENKEKQDPEKEVIPAEKAKEESSTESTGAENMYVFEGKDYSKEPSTADRKAFDEIIAAERLILGVAGATDSGEGGRVSRRKGTSTLVPILPDLPKKQGKKLSPEELEARRKRRAELAAQRAKEQEEEEVRKAQEKRKRRAEMWAANDYTSCNLTCADDDDDEDVTMTIDDGDDNTERRDICYISGDVTHPEKTGKKDAIIVHCVDDSGRWGHGGVFTALDTRSTQPSEQYQLAGKMKDLALGDVHLVSVDDVQCRAEGKDYCALVVAQHRDRSNNLSGIKLSALLTALKHIYKCAKEKSASVHLPRIGYNTRGFNWYGTERLIRKYLASKGIPTYIYYYPRRRHAKRRRSTVDSDDSGPKPSTSKERRTSVDSDRSSTKCNSRTSTPTLPSFLHGIQVYFHNIEDTQVKKFSRYVLACDGDVNKTVGEGTTHVITNTDEEKYTQDISNFQQTESEHAIEFVSLRWLQDCVAKKKLLPCDMYETNFKHE